MRPCELLDTADVEMYFYGELDPAGRARVEGHLRACEPCRHRLDDLHEIRRVLASRPVVEAPPAGDWSGFMRRLDAAVARDAEPSSLRTFEPPDPNPGTLELWNPRTWIALAAVMALVAGGVFTALRVRSAPETRVAVTNLAVETPVKGAQKAAPSDRALREGSAELLERSKLVVLGLATRDPRARSQDWQYERALAGTLLNDTRLYRQAAVQGGASDVARVMRDLETVLLEASMSDRKDPDSLGRVQRLIAKRDLVVKMQVMAAAGHAAN
jgi:putative zinc finger protein